MILRLLIVYILFTCVPFEAYAATSATCWYEMTFLDQSESSNPIGRIVSFEPTEGSSAGKTIVVEVIGATEVGLHFRNSKYGESAIRWDWIKPNSFADLSYARGTVVSLEPIEGSLAGKTVIAEITWITFSGIHFQRQNIESAIRWDWIKPGSLKTIYRP